MDDIVEFAHTIRSIYDARERFSLIVDVTGFGGIGISYLRRFTAELKAMRPLTRQFLVDVTVVLSSSVTRTMLNTLLWLMPPIVPVHVLTPDDLVAAETVAAGSTVARPEGVDPSAAE
jgi:hypothetical protein